MSLGQCPKCGGDLAVRKGKYGKFIGCKNYYSNKCKYTRQYTGPPLSEEACQSNELQCWDCLYEGTDNCYILKNI